MKSFQIWAYSLKTEYTLRGEHLPFKSRSLHENGRVIPPERVSIHLTSDVVKLKCHTTYNYGTK